MSIGLITFVRVIAPFPGGVIYVGNFELDPHGPEHVAKPAGLRTNLEKHYGIAAVKFGKDVVGFLLGQFLP